MALSFTGATGSTSVTIPSHVAGDLIIAFAYRDGSFTPPSLPSGQNWTNLFSNSGASTNSHRIAVKIARDSSEVSGTFTNATDMLIVVVNSSLNSTIGYKLGALGSGVSTTLSYTGFTLDKPFNNSRVLLFAGHRSVDTTTNVAPTDYTNITSRVVTGEIAAHSSNNTLASLSTFTQSVGGTSSGWRTHTFEVWEVIPPIIAESTLQGSSTAEFLGLVFQLVDGFRASEQDDFRVTEAGVSRITEKLTEAFAELSGNGLIDADGTVTAIVIQTGEAVLSGSSSLVSDSLKTILGETTFNSSGTIVSIGSLKTNGFVNLNASGTFNSTGEIKNGVFSDLISQSTFTVVPKLYLNGNLNLSSTGSSLFAGEKTFKGSLNVNGSSTLVCVASSLKEGTLNGIASSTLVSQAKVKLVANVNLTSQSLVSALGLKPNIIAGSAFSATSNLGVNVSLIIYGQVGLFTEDLFRNTEQDDQRILENNDERITEETLFNYIRSSLVVESNRIPFTSISYVKVEGVWKEFIPYVNNSNTWKVPHSIYKKVSSSWKRIY